jgi:hypothetical protein
MQVNLHVDQKEASYEGTSAHGGEYEGPLVEQEMTRITQFIVSLGTPQPPQATQPKQPPATSTPQKKSKYW